VIKAKLPQKRFDNWFRTDTITNVTRRGNLLTVWVADEYAQVYMEDHFATLVQDAAFEVSGRNLRLEFKTDNRKTKDGTVHPLKLKDGTVHPLDVL
jgi:chromosomal replication initiation ATPase DnaA